MNQVTYLKQREGETIQELAKRIAAAHDAMRNPQQEIISREEARSQGLKFYFTGETCPRGGVNYRRVSNCNCMCDKCREARAEYNRRYFEENRESRSEYNRHYHKENREARAEHKRSYYKENREAITKRRRRYYEENREFIAEYNRRYREENHEAITKLNRRYNEENREARAEYQRRYREENREVVLAFYAKRRAAKRQAIPSWFSEFDEFAFNQAYELAKERKKETGIEWHVDHMIPLLARKCCGLHCADNIQVIPAVMNLEKKNKMQLTEPLEWLR